MVKTTFVEDPPNVQALSENSNSMAENMETEDLGDYSDEMALDDNEMEHEEDDLVVESQDEIEHEEEIIQTEEDIEPQEVEIRSEDHRVATEEVVEKRYKPASSVPPLRLLNIAPKPEQVPIAVKSVSGQPLILVPGAAGGQGIKLVNPHGQEINLANYSLSRPITIKQTTKPSVTTTPVIQQTQGKQIFMKKIITTSAGQKTITKPISFGKSGQQFVVVHKSNDSPKHIKLVQSAITSSMSSSAPVQSQTITFQQAQEMGLLGSPKIVQSGLQQIPTKRTVLINKAQPKTIKFVPQSASNQIVNNPTTNLKTISLGHVKSPTKILPAAITNMASANKVPQRIIFKSAGGNQMLPTGQLIQLAGTHGIANGQIHQINVPGKGVQYIKFVTATTAEPTNSTVSLVNTVKTTAASPVVSTTVLPDIKPVITNKIVSKPSPTKPTQVMIVPAGYIPANMQQVQKVAIPAVKQPVPQPKQVVTTTASRPLAPVASPSPEPASASPTGTASTTASPNENPSNNANGIRPRKPCNCTKSQCLKLYCDCFANGEFCYLCNCINCFNNLENEDTRNLAIKACLERNPNAFRPKIGKAKDIAGDVLRKHTKGCNCKRSGCLKNYCECYEAKIACSSNCKCVGCRNVEDSIEKRGMEMNSSAHRISDEDLAQTVYRKILLYKDADSPSPARLRKSSSRKQPITFITDEVIEATCQCLLTISDDADSNMQDEELTKRQIIEEFGGCLNEIIHCSINRNG